jgi:hypothetical protein
MFQPTYLFQISLLSFHLMFLMISSILLALVSLFLWKATKIVFERKEFLVVLIIVSVLPSLSIFMPIRKDVITFFQSGTSAAIFEGSLNIVLFFISSIAMGLLTYLMLQVAQSKTVKISDAFLNYKLWLFRGILAGVIGMSGYYLAFFGYIFSTSMFGETFWWGFVLNVWNILTFMLFAFLINDRNKLIISIPNAFKSHFQTIGRWFYLFLLLTLVVGTFNYIWIPQELATSLGSTSQNLSGWNYEGTWFGFFHNSNWYLHIMDLLALPKSNVFMIAYSFINSLIAIIIKITITTMLFDSGHLKKKIE